MPVLSPPAPLATSQSPAAIGLSLGAALDRWYVYLDGSDRIGSKRTITSYKYATGKLVAHVGDNYSLERIGSDDIESLLTDLKRGGMSPAGRMAVFRPIRTFFGWTVRKGMLEASPVEGVEPPKVKVEPVKFVDEAQWAAILATCQSRSRHDFRAVRDRAVLLMLATTGARLSEIAGLERADVNLAADTVLIRHGKGDKERLLPLLPDAKEALLQYLTRGRPRSPWASTPPLWLSTKGAMTPSGIAQMLHERARTAAVPRRVHPHELRHRFIARAMAKGMPGPLLMALSGHTTPAMLSRYGAYTRTEDAMRMLRQFEEAS